jgi:predicted nucleotidyltransferase
LGNFPFLGNINPNMGNKRNETGQVVVTSPVRLTSGVAGALFTTTQQRVIGLLFGHPERSFYVSEMLALTQSGAGALHRELSRLSGAGLVTARAIGKQRHYQANPDSPVFGELVQIVRKTVGAVEPIRVALEDVADQVVLALLYGSAARGQDTATSDFDLLVVSDTLTLERLYRALAPAEATLGRRIQPTLYTAVEFQQRRQSDQSFVSRVLASDTLALIGDKHALGSAR